MTHTEHWHVAKDGKRLFFRRFLPAAAPTAVVHVAHGLAEHSARYQRVAEVLTGAGYAVYADDHRGHGQTGLASNELGFVDGGLARVLEDFRELLAFECAEHPGLPVVFFGHSMGSMLAQAMMQSDGASFAAVVLSASNGKPPPIARVGQLLARLERWRSGPRGTSALLKKLSFDAFNKPFEPGPTAFEWLSRDRAEVDKYVADPLCGFAASNALWVDLLDLLADLARPEAQARIPHALPVFVISGSEDMANERTKGLLQLLGALKAAGLTDVTHRFYPGARHELLNETNRDEVHQDLLAWLAPRLKKAT
ncbi:MAG: alpha/beta hydrolase [Myxococcus sp.]|nr:alpha/beta hydrolase [Myxococcus sp.]